MPRETIANLREQLNEARAIKVAQEQEIRNLRDELATVRSIVAIARTILDRVRA